MSQTAAWVVPTSADLETFLEIFVINASNPMNASGGLRTDNVMLLAIATVRGAIQTGNRIPLSLTTGPVNKNVPPLIAGAVPPEAKWHTLVIAAEALVTAVPQLSDFVESPRFQKMADKANDWLMRVEKGELVPTSPIDPDPNATPAGPEWGDLYGQESGGLSLGKIDVTTN